MRGVNRIVNTTFWQDEKTVNDFSPEDKYFFLYLLTNPHTTQLGIYKLVPKTAAFELGYSKESVICLLDRFESKYSLIRYSKDTNEVAIKNYLRHSVVKGGKPVMDCLLKEERDVEDKSLLLYIYNSINTKDNINTTVKEYIDHLKEIYINDNDNERYVNESSTNRPPSRELKKSNRFIAPSVAEVDAYCEVNNLEYVNPSAFVEFYGSKNWMVGKNKMTNWHMAASGWNRRAIERNEKKYIREKKKTVPIIVHQDRPERFRTAPESTYNKLKRFILEDGTFDWSTYDPSLMSAEDIKWMQENGM